MSVVERTNHCLQSTIAQYNQNFTIINNLKFTRFVPATVACFTLEHPKLSYICQMASVIDSIIQSLVMKHFNCSPNEFDLFVLVSTALKGCYIISLRWCKGSDPIFCLPLRSMESKDKTINMFYLFNYKKFFAHFQF